MPESSPGIYDPSVVSAFHHDLLSGLALVVLVSALAAGAWMVFNRDGLTGAFPGAGVTDGGTDAPTGGTGDRVWAAGRVLGGDRGRSTPEPAARVILRVGFGVLWLFDGLLKGQAGMPLGMPGQVLAPAGAGSPGWLAGLVNDGADLWSRHPLPVASAALWVEVGLGVWLLGARSLRSSRAAGLATVAWAGVIWVGAEAMGGVLAPGLSWLTGAPGPSLLYLLAGAMLAAPEAVFERVAARLTPVLGAFLLGMAVLQAWPGRGWWQGGGGLRSAITDMASTPQPGFLASWLYSVAGTVGRHGWAANLAVVLVTGAAGVSLLLAVRAGGRAIVIATGAAIVLCLVVWVLVQDLGFLGGLGTDPSSAVPLVVLLLTGAARYLTPARVRAAGPVDAVVAAEHAGRRRGPARRFSLYGVVGTAVVATALGLGAVPMAAAAVTGTTSTTLAQSIDGSPASADSPAPPVSLVDQAGRPFSLGAQRGKAVLITFLDPVCTTDCPLIAQELRQADADLGTLASRVEVVAVCANPLYRSIQVLQDFDRQEGLSGLDNWRFVTGSVAQLSAVWSRYGMQVSVVPAGGMVDHPDAVFVVGPGGRLRWVLDFDPGPGTTVSQQSMSQEVVALTRSVLG